MKTKRWKKILAFILALSILCSCIIGAVSVYAEQVNSQTGISQNSSGSNMTDSKMQMKKKETISRGKISHCMQEHLKKSGILKFSQPSV